MSINPPKKPPLGFNKAEILVQVPGDKELTRACSISFPLFWYLDEGETVIAKLYLNDKEVGAAIINVIYPEGKKT
jgi:hypothetical protein